MGRKVDHESREWMREAIKGKARNIYKGAEMAGIVLKEESYQIIGSCFEVYNEMGCGFLESVYQECLELEFAAQSIPHAAQQRLSLVYKNRSLRSVYVPDFICFGEVIVEIKSHSDLTEQHRAQVHHYLKATDYKLGLLVNFGQYPKLQYERIVR